MVGPSKTEPVDLLRAKNAVLASMGEACRPKSEGEILLEKARTNMANGLRDLIEGARKGESGAVKKLRIFGSVSDPAVATKLALMSHDQRRRYLASQKQARGKIKQRRAREQARKARKG